MERNVLITGGSIAANTLAWWLSHYGFDVTVVERAPEFRDGGQNIDVRGAGREVLRRMGLDEAAMAQGTGEKGMVFVDEDDEVVAEFEMEEGEDNGPTAGLEILRGDLARLLYDACRERVAYRFGDWVTAIENGGDAVKVTFESGREETYALVVIAEGVGSATRELVFPGENEPRWMDVQMGYFTIPKGPKDTDFARWYNAPGGRSVFLRPDGGKGTTRAVLTLQGETNGEEKLRPEEQKGLLRERFADAGWETPRVLEGLENTQDFYYDVLRQVKMDRWSKGRVVVTGDAAWCATPLGGIGTTLAVVGAYVLAGEVATKGIHSEAFAAYDRILRPYVEKGQGVPKVAPKMAQPHTRFGVALQRTLLGIAASPGVRKIALKLFAPPADEIELPDYAGAPSVLLPEENQEAGRA